MTYGHQMNTKFLTLWPSSLPLTRLIFRNNSMIPGWHCTQMDNHSSVNTFSDMLCKQYKFFFSLSQNLLQPLQHLRCNIEMPRASNISYKLSKHSKTRLRPIQRGISNCELEDNMNQQRSLKNHNYCGIEQRHTYKNKWQYGTFTGTPLQHIDNDIL